MSQHINRFKSWADTYHQDVDALKALVESGGADIESRRLAAGALNYLVTKLDLVPDHQDIGIMDDLMVIRVCSMLASAQHQLGQLATNHEITIGRLGNEAEKITPFLGEQLYDKLKLYCAKLAETAVRGRTPSQIVDDEAARKALYVEIEDELKKATPVVIEDPADAELRLKSYLTHKLS